MPLSLRLLLIIASLITMIFVFRKIRKAQFVVEDTLYWLFFCLFLLVLSIFPQLSFTLAKLCGFEAASNFVFVSIIFLLLVKLFLMSVKISKLENKMNQLVQKYALDHKKNNM